MSFRGKNFKQRKGSSNWRNDRSRAGPSLFTKRKVDKSEYKHRVQLAEKDVGITEYISDLEGYSAIIKARFSDFQVNEIDKDGRVAKLTSTRIPTAFTPSEDKSYKDTINSPLENIPQDIWHALREVAVNKDATTVVELDAENLSKEERKNIHQSIKSYFGKDIVASTVQKEGKTLMTFKLWNKKDGNNRSEWPADIPEFVHFVVYKEMMDTMDACFKIAQALRVPVTKISYAGVKDKRGKTTQWCCIKKYQPQKLSNYLRRVRNVKVGNFEFKTKCLKIGDLSGNRFRVALRNVIAEDDLINKSLTHVKDHGFINYYGMQRFGNEKEVPTYLIGLKLLQGLWKEAINLILKVKPGDDPTELINTAKQVYADTGDAVKALKLCDKRYNGLEKKLLEGLAQHHGNDYVNALESIPRGTRLMYIHAFQSLVWNRMASKRIKQFGLNPVEGDLILVSDIEEEELVVSANENDEGTASSSNDQDNGLVESKTRLQVRPLVAEELHNYSIFDVVLPLPGYDVVYPENLKQCYKEVIEEYGLTMEMPKQRVKTYNLSGTYRKLVQQVQDMEWKIMYYNDPTDNLIRSDLEELKGEEEPQSMENGTYKAVVVAFTLNAASYATMVLREVLKCNTSSSFQAKLNKYSDTNDSTEAKTNGQESSLLADAEKYKDFQKSIFCDILEEPENQRAKKRDLEEQKPGEAQNNKKLKSSS